MKKITILLSLLLAAAASAGDFGWLGGGGGVARIDTGSISTAHVMADTVSPFNESTVYIRNATFDTVTIREYIHNQEISLFDSLSWWASDVDTFKIDPTVGANVLEYEDENVVVAALDSAGNWTAQNLIAEKRLAVTDSARNEGPLRQKGASTFGATATPAIISSTGSMGIGISTEPIHKFSIVNSGGLTNALHIVNSTINKNRTTQAQSVDSASIWLGTLSTGQPMLRMRSEKSDSLSIYTKDTYGYLSSKNVFYFVVGGVGNVLVLGSTIINFGVDITPGADDARSFGSVTKRINSIHSSDNIYLGGKGQTATLTVGTQNTMTEQTDSCVVVTPVNGSGSVKLASATGSIMHYMGVQGPTFDASTGMSWLSPVADGTDTLWYSIDGTNATYWIGAARAVKH